MWRIAYVRLYYVGWVLCDRYCFWYYSSAVYLIIKQKPIAKVTGCVTIYLLLTVYTMIIMSAGPRQKELKNQSCSKTTLGENKILFSISTK